MILRPSNPVRSNWGALREARRGILLHYDASSSDGGALTWLTQDARCEVSYNVLILDDGKAYAIAPQDRRAWHAGRCRPSDDLRMGYTDANSAFYGVSIAATDGEVATPAQFAAVVDVCRMLAQSHGWNLAHEPWRLVGHSAEAWPRGRKVDPEGSNKLRPVLSVAAVRAAFTQPPSCAA